MTQYTQGWNAGKSDAVLYHVMNSEEYARRVRQGVAGGDIHPEYAAGQLDAWEKHRLMPPGQYASAKVQVNNMKRRGETRGLLYRHLLKAVTDHEQHRPRFDEIRKEIMRKNNSAYTQRQKEITKYKTNHPSVYTSAEYVPLKVKKNERTAYQRGWNAGEKESVIFHHVNPANYARGVQESVAKGEIHPEHAAGKLDAWEKHRLMAPEQYANAKVQVNNMKRRGETRGLLYRHLLKAVTNHEQHRPRFDAIRKNIKNRV